MHDWAGLLAKFEDLPASLGVSDEVQKATLAELQQIIQLEDIKTIWMNNLRERCVIEAHCTVAPVGWQSRQRTLSTHCPRIIALCHGQARACS
jgi:hypothetical protein